MSHQQRRPTPHIVPNSEIPQTDSKDHRLDNVLLESADMASQPEPDAKDFVIDPLKLAPGPLTFRYRDVSPCAVSTALMTLIFAERIASYSSEVAEPSHSVNMVRPLMHLENTFT